MGEPSDQITFRFDGFEATRKLQFSRQSHADFLGVPVITETFVCTFVGENGGNSWVTLDQGEQS